MRKRIYNKKGYKVFEYYFETLQSLIDHITTAPTNTYVFFENSLSSKKAGKDDFNFRKTHSLDEAIRLCIGGWDEEFDTLLKLKEKVDNKLLKEKMSSKKIKNCVGFAPCVGDFLRGNPINMWNRINEPNYQVVNIYVNIACSCRVSTSAIYNRGSIVLSIIDALEKTGYGVRLILFDFSIQNKEACLYYFNIKDETENLNIKKAYFVLCHPSFLRRIIFRLTEVTDFMEYGWSNSYGTVPSQEETMDFFDFDKESDIIILAPNFMGVYGNDIYEDLNSLLKSTNLLNLFKV